MAILVFLTSFWAFVPAGAPCDETGPRVQILYTHPGADRYVELLPVFAAVRKEIDRVAGPYRQVRWSCSIPSIRVGEDPAELRAGGYIRPDWKYLVLFDRMRIETGHCGWAQNHADDRPGADNLNNVGGEVGLLYSHCWFGTPPAHTLFHLLGAVQPSAPFADTEWHCYDPENLGGIFNCGPESYYDPDPPAGSYLATHWNTANSRFLDVTEPPVKYEVYLPYGATR